MSVWSGEFELALGSCEEEVSGLVDRGCTW
jgi:hypothetical protein